MLEDFAHRGTHIHRYIKPYIKTYVKLVHTHIHTTKRAFIRLAITKLRSSSSI